MHVFLRLMPTRSPRLPPGAGKAERGRFGEDLAAAHCRARGYRIVRRNWRRGRDEIDLVCRDGRELVFIEVRARAESALVPGYFTVDRRKKKVLRRACTAYLRSLRKPPAHFRFDIIEVALSMDGAGTVRQYENVPLFHKHFSPGRLPADD
jgi:putative endonuclease